MTIKARVKHVLNQLQLRWYTSKYQLPDNYRRIYHYHIRKSAGTSLNTAFWSLAGLNLQSMGRRCQVCRKGLIFVRHQPSLINQGNYFYGNSHNPAHRLQLPKETFTITILRDPLSRLLSYYRYLLYIKNSPQAKQQEPFYQEVSKEALNLGNSFQDFLDRIPQKTIIHQLKMFSKNGQVDEAVDRVLQCSIVCFTESFSEDLGRINQRLQLSLTERRDRSFAGTLDLSPADLAAAREVLAPEFEFIETVQKKLAA
ncbi:sulfotransferase family 2 domain-containing protein [Prochlorothrix hollandica]|nr:sulfotransferase family 2 domain-containing protein [Prochlorothrix hollandica]